MKLSGNDILNGICILLNADTAVSGREIENSALFCINSVLLDLGFDDALTRLDSEIEVSKDQKNAIIYGAAALVSVNICESEHTDYLKDVFKGLRAKALSSNSAVKNAQPRIIF